MTFRAILLGLLITMTASFAQAQVEYIEGQGGVAGVDKSGKGAVLCAWQVLVTAQLTREPCGAVRQPIDDEIDASVAKIDAFIIENAKRYPATAEGLAAEKASIVQIPLDLLQKHPEGRVEICTVSNMFHAMPSWPPLARHLAAAAVRHQVTDLLSIPREPVMNPCL